MTAKAPVRRCAVYTRKSSEEGLEQDFNSLHAQREACEAFIRSQRGEGWRLIETAYDDCGLSGGTLGGGPCGRRSALRSWRELLLDLKRRGLVIGPELAVADGALGFWQVIEEVWPKTRGQRCWVHKTANVLNKLPESQQPVQGPRDTAGLLRLSGRALETPAHLQPHRKQLCHRAPSHRALEGLPLQQDGARHDLHARPGGREELASPRRPQPVAEGDPGCRVRRRYRSRKATASSRRLTSTVTKIRQ